ncbi:MAG: hypothetical protein JSW21_03930, partial [Gammaproteobacteria bacterium]
MKGFSSELPVCARLEYVSLLRRFVVSLAAIRIASTASVGAPGAYRREVRVGRRGLRAEVRSGQRATIARLHGSIEFEGSSGERKMIYDSIIDTIGS